MPGTFPIAGDTARAHQVIANLRRICGEQFGERYELRIVDVMADPEAAEHARLLATLPLPPWSEATW